MKNLLLLVLLGGVASALSACNTIGGAGADVANTGMALERAATPYYW